jgi:asparagine synthase (glutamine-hydrolysing)
VGAIIGRLSFDSDAILTRAVLDRMLDASARRRSEIRDLFTAPGVALGSCRLGSRDVATVAEPYIGANDRGNVRAVADSRLTNAGELRAVLEREGHRFHTGTDEELMVRAYERWGTRAFERLHGPFACAIWDETNRRLVLARDHVGIRPLYFALLQGHGLVFATDVRALVQDPGVAHDWCPDAIDAYLALGYIPAPLTAYRRVSKLQPAHYLLVEGRCLHLEEFWDFPMPSRSAARNGLVAIAGTLKDAVRRETTDHRGAALLYSGGTASSALLSVTPPASGIAITVDADQDPSDLTRSNAAAAHLGRIRELETPTAPMSLLVEELAEVSGEPLADPAALTQLAICKVAARRSDTAVGGHGAGVLWGGSEGGTFLSRFARLLDAPSAQPSKLWEDRQRRSIYTRAFAWKVRDINPCGWHLARWASRVGAKPRDRALYMNARTLLPDNVLAIAAHASDAAGISLRFPFLERQMAELAMEVPASVKRRGRGAMSALLRLLAPQLPPRLLPPALLQPAQHAWLPGALTTLVPKMLLGPRFDGRDIVSRPALRQLWTEHLDARADHSRRLWALLMLEFWFREFIDGDAAAEPLEYAVLVKAA